MIQLDQKTLSAYRQKTFRSNSSSRIHNREEAVQFVNQRGFIFFWPITGLSFPSLWVAAAGDRPVADEHDDPGHITWGWKDDLLGKGLWYYGRVLARKNCMIALDSLPYFYALSPNFGDPENDYLDDYQRGHLTLEAKNVYEVLLREGPMDSISLKRAAHLSSTGAESRFNRALEILQVSLRLAPVGISTNGAWHYSFIYDLFHRHYNPAIEESREISEDAARLHILKKFFASSGTASISDMTKMFHWHLTDLKQSLETLLHEELIAANVELPGNKQTVYALSELV